MTGKQVTFNNDMLETFKSHTIGTKEYRDQVISHANEVGTVVSEGYAIVTVKYGSE